MSGHISAEWLPLFVIALYVIVRIFFLVRRFWNQPLNHGPGFFLGVEVAPGFYAGDGVGWLRRYRTMLLAEHLVEALALAAILVSGRWNLLPAWAGGTAVLLCAVLFGFMGYTRATLGANPPARTSAVVSLETRRLGDYISWPAEVLIAVIIALSWALLFTHSGVRIHWNFPVVVTYVVAGLLPFKIGVVRNSFPLPSERTEEHHQWEEANRRYSLRVLDVMRWVFIVPLAGYALLKGWPAATGLIWTRWLFMGIGLAVWIVLMGIIIRGSGRLAAMGRDLRPVGSWSGPFRPARLMMPGFLGWYGAWFGGLVLLLVFFRR